MLRGEVQWFPQFLVLCRDMCLQLPLNHPYRLALERILTCDSYRRVRPLLKDQDLELQFELFYQRSRAMSMTSAPLK